MTIRRSGGFAGLTREREVEITPETLKKLREDRLQPATPDAFTYELTVDGRTFRVPHSAIIEELLR